MIRRLFLCLLLGASLAAIAAEPPPVTHRFVATLRPLGPDTPGDSVNYSVLWDRLGARPGFAVEPQRARPGVPWYQRPPQVDAQQWLCVLTTTFGLRQNWLALQFAGPEGAVSLATWRQSLAAGTSSKYSYINTIPPGPDSTLSLAQIELAAAIGQAAVAPPGPPRPLVGLVVESWKNVGDAAPVNLLGGDDDAAPAQPATGEALDAIRAMSLVAAWEAGLQPTLAARDPRLTLRLSRVVEGYGVEAEWREGETTRVVRRQRIPETMLYPGLVATIRWAHEWGPAVNDLIQVTADPIRPLGYHRPVLAYQSHAAYDKTSLHGVNSDTLLPLWSIPLPDRGRVNYAVAPLPNGTPSLWQIEPALVPLPWEKAVATRIPHRTEINYPWGFQPGEGDDVIALVGHRLIAYRGPRVLWQADHTMPLAAGPLHVGEQVIAGSDAGQLVAHAWADGAAQWTRQVDDGWLGPLVAAGGLVIGATRRGTVLATRLSDGQPAWQAESDTLLGGLRLLDAQRVLLVSGKIVRVLAANDGHELARAELPAVLTGAAVLAPPAQPPQVGLMDAAGTVTFLRGKDLAVRRTVPLHVNLLGAPLYLPEVPARWGIGDELVDHAPALLVAGADAVCYLLPLPPEEP